MNNNAPGFGPNPDALYQVPRGRRVAHEQSHGSYIWRSRWPKWLHFYEHSDGFFRRIVWTIMLPESKHNFALATLSQKIGIVESKSTKYDIHSQNKNSGTKSKNSTFWLSKSDLHSENEKKNGPKLVPKSGNHILLPTKSVKKQWFLYVFSCLKI